MAEHAMVKPRHSLTIMTRAVRAGRFACALLMGASLAGAVAVHDQPPQTDTTRIPVLPSPDEMERDLLRALNGERAARNLPALRPSPALVELARAQSVEMARQNILSHESAAGKSLTERLASATLLFDANAENIARSGTFLINVIHQSFMDSPGHGANVLSPLFDEVGIGIVPGAGNTYFITEDFIKSLPQKPVAEVRSLVLGAMNAARASRNLPPIVRTDDADRTAQAFAEDKAAGRPLAPAPNYFGATRTRLVVGPDLDAIASALENNDLDRYGSGGIGVWFGRSAEYPGGAYVVCGLFVRDDAGLAGPVWPAGSADMDRVRAVLTAVNDVRTRNKLDRLDLDPALSRQADAAIARRGKDSSPRGQRDIFLFKPRQLAQIDASLRKRLADPRLGKIGISTRPDQPTSGRTMMYTVAVVLAP